MWARRKSTALQARQLWIPFQARLCDLGQVALVL